MAGWNGCPLRRMGLRSSSTPCPVIKQLKHSASDLMVGWHRSARSEALAEALQNCSTPTAKLQDQFVSWLLVSSSFNSYTRCTDWWSCFSKEQLIASVGRFE